jgi:uncharacterized membrane protein YphA (DoxX/SURF4 family)
LLLLRAATGVTVAVQGATYVSGRSNSTIATWAVCCFAIVCGSLLLIGLFTPLASALLALGGIVVSLSYFTTILPNLFGAKLTIFFVVIMAAAIALLGPGAYSIDARLFGRREIIIPRPPAD